VPVARIHAGALRIGEPEATVTHPQGSAPLACTLSAGSYQERGTWIAQLNRDGLREPFPLQDADADPGA
jgi:hypothetical protein